MGRESRVSLWPVTPPQHDNFLHVRFFFIGSYGLFRIFHRVLPRDFSLFPQTPGSLQKPFAPSFLYNRSSSRLLPCEPKKPMTWSHWSMERRMTPECTLQVS